MAFFLTNLKESGKLDNVQMTVGIVGSRKLFLGDDYGSTDWGLLAPNLTIYGFDADVVNTHVLVRRFIHQSVEANYFGQMLSILEI